MAHHVHLPDVAVLGAITLDAIALGAAVTLVFAAGTGSVDRALAVGVLVAALTALLIGRIDVTPATRPGTTGRLLGRELIVVTLALASIPVALAFEVRDELETSTVVLAAVVVVALAARMALLTRNADRSGRAQAGTMARLNQLAMHDPLTGLPNRALLEDRLTMAAAGQRRSGSVLAVLFCDLDKFKAVNDTAGHDAGDAVLVVMAERLQGAVRATDTVSRLGGDEFVVLCPGLTTETELVELVERLLAVMAEPMDVGGRQVAVSCSIGVSLVGPGGPTPSVADIIREADVAMYQAKANGRSGWARLDGARLTAGP